MTAASPETWRDAGWAAAPPLPERLLAPVRAAAARALAERPWPELLCGVHNPFGRHACVADAWSFLDIGESDAVLDPVAGVLGPDLVLWDSEIRPDAAGLDHDEAAWWPVAPLAGALVLIALSDGAMRLIDITRLAGAVRAAPPVSGPILAFRYMPATSRYVRDPRAPQNQCGAERRVLVNLATRPLWLVRGRDHAGNDFATGFALPAAQWAGASSLDTPSTATPSNP